LQEEVTQNLSEQIVDGEMDNSVQMAEAEEKEKENEKT
jgi:hypothetical protein